MNHRDWQRVLAGVSAVVQEAARLHAPELAQRAQTLQAHATDLASRVPSVLPLVLNRVSGRGWEPAPGAAPPSSTPAGDEHEEFRQEMERSAPAYTPAADGAAHAPAAAPVAAPRRFERPAERPHIDLATAAGLRRDATAPSLVVPAAAAAAPAPAPAPALPAAPPATAAPIATAAPTAPTAPIAPQLIEPPEEAPALEQPDASPPSSLPSPTPRRTRVFRERAVPASPLARVFGFGSLAATMALGAAGNAISQGLGLSAASGSSSSGSSSSSDYSSGSSSSSSGGGSDAGAKPMLNMSEAQAERLAEGLCRMRGAALKIGQMLSLSDETMIPPAIAKALERVRTQADIMPRRQLEKVMIAELGADWRDKLGGAGFEDQPVAAASIGQVHRATLHDGRVVAVKVQYPGVAESINSDLNNLKRLLLLANFLPKGLYLDSVIQVAREELTNECDYRREAAAQQTFQSLVGTDPDFEVPSVVPELSTRRVLTTTWLRGVPIDQVVEAGAPIETRNRIARKLLRLTLKELFDWRYMQTDPNWGNFFYDPSRDVIGLLDFGATREYRKEFVDDYLRLVWAAANKDRETIRDVSVKLGFLTGYESKVMMDAHIESGLVVGEPFVTREAFDFKGSGITARVSKHGAVFAEHRLTPPPSEVYSLHRKLAGAYFICIRMGAVMPCRDMLEETYNNYKWGPLEPEVPAHSSSRSSESSGRMA